MRKFTPFILSVATASILLLGFTHLVTVNSAPPDFNITLSEVIASGFNYPVQVASAKDSTERLFVVEQPGYIQIIQDGNKLTTPFLDVHNLVLYGGERGLLGLAFHPDYASNGYFYINYTRSGDGATVIARYHVSVDPNIADAGSAAILLTISQPYSNHNGGQVMFGPDGFLYIGMGDGGSGGDPQNNAQNINSLLGKLLRIDVDSAFPYAIPPGNPYVGVDGLDEIWALGLRNPWRWSFDSMNGDLYIGDVGQNLWEEVDYYPASQAGGLNFGWHCLEGTHPYNNTNPPCDNSSFVATLTPPITEYSHSEGVAVTGGFVYRGSQYPNLYGTYFFGDYGSGTIWSIKQLSSNPVSWSTRQQELVTGLNISAFGEDENAEIYVCDYKNGGKIYHLEDASGSPDLSQSKKFANSQWGDPSETLTYTVDLINTGGSLTIPLHFTDTLPSGLIYISGTLTSSSGTSSDAFAPILLWTGSLTSQITMTLRYQAMVSPTFTGTLSNQAILASSEGVLINLFSSVFIPRPKLATTAEDFFLPGTQPDTLNSGLIDSLDCDTCHNAAIYDRWRGSTMSQAGRDPLMWAALSASNNFVPNSGELCLRCHTAMGWFAGHSANPNGVLLTHQEIDNGVSCQTCHRMVDPVSGSTDEAQSLDNIIRGNLSSPPPAGTTGGGMMVIDPNDNRRGPFSFGGNIPYHTTYQTDFLGQVNNAISRSRLCGTCHNVYNPLLSWDGTRMQFWPNSDGEPASSFDSGNLYPIETTFDEWYLSDYATGGVYAPQFAGSKPDHIVSACQDCHLQRTTGQATDPAFNPVTRDCISEGCLPEHALSGANAWLPLLLSNPEWRLNAASESSYLETSRLLTQQFLSKSASLEVNLVDDAGSKTATVRVINEAGHKLPTGYAEGRRMWINLKAFDTSGNLIQEYGAYNPTTGEVSNDTTIFEVQQGITPELATYLNLPSGHSFHFLLNNDVIKDNRIPPRGYTNAAFDSFGLRPVAETYADGQFWHDTEFTLPAETVSVHASLYYQVASKAYIDFLKQNGGVDGQALYDLWNATPSPAQMVIIKWYPEYLLYYPLIYR
jgi:uncharacterized repeat protein (TIGR01451 family)